MNSRPEIPEVNDPSAAPDTRGIVLRKAASVYDLLSPAMLFWQEQPINHRATRLLELTPSSRVLDVGCATGGMTLALAAYLKAEQGGLAIGLDASPEMIGVARNKIRKLPARFDIGVAEKLPYPDATFDAAASTFFFHHLNLEDKLIGLKEMHRVIRPGGFCVIVDVDIPTNLIGKISAHSGAWLFKQAEIVENIEGKLPPLFEQAGFQDIERKAHNLGYITTFRMKKA